jgi:aspartyl-tRNA synthetase
MAGKVVLMQARIQSSRVTGSKMTFLVLRQRLSTVQALVVVDEKISKQMVKYASKYALVYVI